MNGLNPELVINAADRITNAIEIKLKAASLPVPSVGSNTQA